MHVRLIAGFSALLALVLTACKERPPQQLPGGTTFDSRGYWEPLELRDLRHGKAIAEIPWSRTKPDAPGMWLYFDGNEVENELAHVVQLNRDPEGSDRLLLIDLDKGYVFAQDFIDAHEWWYGPLTFPMEVPQ